MRHAYEEVKKPPNHAYLRYRTEFTSVFNYTLCAFNRCGDMWVNNSRVANKLVKHWTQRVWGEANR